MDWGIGVPQTHWDGSVKTVISWDASYQVLGLEVYYLGHSVAFSPTMPI